jgi:hypothetical protein
VAVPALTPTTYHRELRDALRAQEPGLWAWYASDRFTEAHSERARLELLKATYRLDPAGHEPLYADAAAVAGRLGIDAPITLYQDGSDGSMNAGLCFVPGEVHVVFTGPVLTRLEPVELRGLLGHELAHYRLWTEGDGGLRVADAVVEAVAAHPDAPTSWVQLALRQRRYTEIYADRGTLTATDGDLDAAVRCLLKLASGVEQPDAAAYVRQVHEVLARTAFASEAETHPEMFLRVWAMERWLADPASVDSLLEARVLGARSLESLDLLQQLELTRQTRALVTSFLRLPGLRTDSISAHARQFFPDLEPSTGALLEAAVTDDSVAEYFGYVLLDLATADPDLEEAPLVAALACADEHGFGPAFDKLARKELKLTIAKVAELRRAWPRIQVDLARPPGAAT